MAKRKTKNIQKVEAKAEEVLTSTKPQALGYQGKLCIKIMSGNKVISTEYLKNKGDSTLFKFLCQALAGNFYTHMRPCKIKLYDFQNTETVLPSEFNFTDAEKVTPYLYEASPYVVYDSTPAVNPGSDSCTTTFKFKIPYHWLFSKRYNVIQLVTDTNQSCAYYLCTDTNGNWNTKELTEATGNFSLVVEWTLEVSNK